MFASCQRVAVVAWPRVGPGLCLLERLECVLFLAWLQVWLFAEIQAQCEKHLENHTRAQQSFRLKEIHSQSREWVALVRGVQLQTLPTVLRRTTRSLRSHAPLHAAALRRATRIVATLRNTRPAPPGRMRLPLHLPRSADAD